MYVFERICLTNYTSPSQEGTLSASQKKFALQIFRHLRVSDISNLCYKYATFIKILIGQKFLSPR